MKKRLLIAGGTGLIGQAVKKLALKDGWEVTILSRTPGENHIEWDPANGYINVEEPLGFDAVINLAGASIAGSRWTAKRKKLILDSRIQSCATIEKYISKGLLNTACYIGASAIGIYGRHRKETVDENTIIDLKGDWLAETTKAWEDGHKRIEVLGIRTVILRIGLVLSRQGGALKEIIQTAPFGFLGYFGGGHQVWSWIHIQDLARIALMACTAKEFRGVFLGTAPFPVTNKAITSAISKSYTPSRLVIPVPEFALSLLLGEMHTMLLQNCTCYPQRLVESGFQFDFLRIEDAVKELMQ